MADSERIIPPPRNVFGCSKSNRGGLNLLLVAQAKCISTRGSVQKEGGRAVSGH